MPAPEVLSGLRAPRTVRLEEARQREAAAVATPPEVAQATTQSDATVYRSRYDRYRVQVTAPSTIHDPVTGQNRALGREIAAQFDNGVFRNDDPDPEVRALIDKTLQSNKYFGKFGTLLAHYWLESEQNASLKEARIKSALETLKSVPAEALEQHIASLRRGDAEDHEIPPPSQPASTGVRPIPPSAE